MPTYNDGHKDGYAAGLIDGKANAELSNITQTDLNKAVSDARDDARKEGYASGYTAGKSDAEGSNTIQPVAQPTTKVRVEPEGNHSYTVYITDTGKKYHASGCRYLEKSKHAISVDNAKARGYTPCKVCYP